MSDAKIIKTFTNGIDGVPTPTGIVINDSSNAGLFLEYLHLSEEDKKTIKQFQNSLHEANDLNRISGNPQIDFREATDIKDYLAFNDINIKTAESFVDLIHSKHPEIEIVRNGYVVDWETDPRGEHFFDYLHDESFISGTSSDKPSIEKPDNIVEPALEKEMSIEEKLAAVKVLYEVAATGGDWSNRQNSRDKPLKAADKAQQKANKKGRIPDINKNSPIEDRLNVLLVRTKAAVEKRSELQTNWKTQGSTLKAIDGLPADIRDEISKGFISKGI